MIITRFAPSPTGFLHIGSARTALFNWLYSRAKGGKFLLRIEDTDAVRSSAEATAGIIEALQWLGLNWDDEVVIQSQRANRHREVAMELLARGKAYRCYLSSEEADRMRANNPYAKISSPWRNDDGTLVPPMGVQPVIRLKSPIEGEALIDDLVQGQVRVQNKELDDMVLLRADGTPTYMLAVVVDDHDMGVTHIIRGDDHLTNAFRQERIYEAMEWASPTYAHIPLIHDEYGKKLSKRLGSADLADYRDQGYVAEAMCNYLLRLGWGGGDEDVISMDEAKLIFDIGAVSKAPARFSWDKLNHFNAYYIRNMDEGALWRLLEPLLHEELLVEAQDLLHRFGDEGLRDSATEEQKVAAIYSRLVERVRGGLSLIKLRAATVKELKELAKLYLKCRMPRDERATEVMANEHTQPLLKLLHDRLKQIDNWNNIAQVGEAVAQEYHCKHALVKQTLQAALLGTSVSPGIYDMMMVIGQKESLHRLKQQLQS